MTDPKAKRTDGLRDHITACVSAKRAGATMTECGLRTYFAAVRFGFRGHMGQWVEAVSTGMLSYEHVDPNPHPNLPGCGMLVCSEHPTIPDYALAQMRTTEAVINQGRQLGLDISEFE